MRTSTLSGRQYDQEVVFKRPFNIVVKQFTAISMQYPLHCSTYFTIPSDYHLLVHLDSSIGIQSSSRFSRLSWIL